MKKNKKNNKKGIHFLLKKINQSVLKEKIIIKNKKIKMYEKKRKK